MVLMNAKIRRQMNHKKIIGIQKIKNKLLWSIFLSKLSKL
jgi:hypothetical protein